ncbi:RNA-directed DNA polymerase [Striga asiatica]|uniref:RNA-directed DNA polymerase n=1 Tax=Striga asiatica TaxID=4170 RepID=A0A5A7QLW4_STRAF|nr:RNA-directed DNA polymerase [Striga asiatica]
MGHSGASKIDKIVIEESTAAPALTPIKKKGVNMWSSCRGAKYRLAEDEVPRRIRRNNSSHLWRQLNGVWKEGMKGIMWILGDGKKTLFWKDVWTGTGAPLLSETTTQIPQESVNAKVAEFVDQNGQWRREEFLSYLPEHAWKAVAAVPPPTSSFGPDRIAWKMTGNRRFSTSSAHQMLCSGQWQPEDRKWKLVWKWLGSCPADSSNRALHIPCFESDYRLSYVASCSSGHHPN